MDGKCSYCANLALHGVCRAAGAPFDGTKVDPTSRCDRYSRSEGLLAMKEGLLAIATGDDGKGIECMREALSHPLPDDERVQAGLFLASGLMDAGLTEEGVDAFENALKLDAAASCHVAEQHLDFFMRLDAYYALRLREACESAEESYHVMTGAMRKGLADVAPCAHMPVNPLVFLQVELGPRMRAYSNPSYGGSTDWPAQGRAFIESVLATDGVLTTDNAVQARQWAAQIRENMIRRGAWKGGGGRKRW